MLSNDILLIAALRLIKTYDSGTTVIGSPAFLIKMYDLRKAVSLYTPIDREFVNKASIDSVAELPH